MSWCTKHVLFSLLFANVNHILIAIYIHKISLSASLCPFIPRYSDTTLTVEFHCLHYKTYIY